MYICIYLCLQRRRIESSIQDLRTKWKVKVARSFPTLCNPMDWIAHGFSRPECWSEWPIPSSVDLPDPETRLGSPSLQADSLFTNWAIRETLTKVGTIKVVDTVIWVDNIRVVNTVEKVKVKSPSRVWLFATPWTVAHQAPPSIESPRQEHWSGLPFGLKRR